MAQILKGQRERPYMYTRIHKSATQVRHKRTIDTELFVSDEKKTRQLCLTAGYCDMPGAYYSTSLSSGEDILTDDASGNVFILLYRCQ